MSDFRSESPHLQAPGVQPSGIARRRLLRAGLAATPVVLAVSGRSAMAQSCPIGLSPATFASINPSNDGCIASSHTHTASSSSLGRSPGYWKPNPNGQTFQPPYPWPIPPFTTVKNQNWDPSKYLLYKNIASSNSCWQSGRAYNSVFTGSSEGRSFSRILLDDNGSTAWHFCAAYLNAAAMPAGTYAITIAEVLSIAATGRLVPGGNQLTDGQIKAFLAQTWA
ncbi:MAG: hypothetical protein ABI606_02805 [Rhodoferax sp.]